MWNRIRMERRDRRNQENWLERAKTEQVTIQLDGYEEQKKQMHMIGLHERDMQLLKAVRSIVEPNLDEVTEAFYSTIMQVEQVDRIIKQYSSVDRLRQTLRVHLDEMFSGNIDGDYLHRRERVARTHIRIGLETKWYMGAFQALQQTLFNIINRHVDDSEQRSKIRESISKVLNFEQQLVLEAYEKENLRLREETYQRVKEEIKSKIAEASRDAVQATDQIAASLQALSEGSTEMNRSFMETVSKTRQTEQWAADGKEKLNALAERVNSVSKTADEMGQTFEAFIESLKSINQVVSLVEQVADQTQLLALNAAIEAARAGEAGAGFQVVASEVRKLSEDTKSGIGEIQALVKRLGEQAGEAVSSMRLVHGQIKETRNESDATNETFDSIMAAMKGNIAEIAQVEQELRKLDGAFHEIGAAAEEVAATVDSLYQTTRSL